ESEGENGCDVPSCFTTFSNILVEDEYEFNFVDDQSLHNEDFSEKIFSNPLFEEEISSIKKNQHHFNAESDLRESMLNRDSSIISSSSKIDSLLDELLYDNSSPRPPEEFTSENFNAEIESFSPSPILDEDSDSSMEEIDLFLTPDDPMLPSIEDDEDSEGDILFERLLHDDPIPLPNTLDFSYEVRILLPFFTYPVTSPVLLSFGSEDKIFDPGITVKDKQEKDKIETKPDKNGKRGEAGKSQKQLQSREQEKLKKMQVEGPKMQTPTKLLKKEERKGLNLQFNKRRKRGARSANFPKLYNTGTGYAISLITLKGCLCTIQNL
nr:hypothetical protein [Tanacetum cinerariifolium]